MIQRTTPDTGPRYAGAALLAIEWMLATTLAVVLAHLVVEIAGAALLGYALLFFVPFIGGVAGGQPVGVLRRACCAAGANTDDSG